MGKNRWEKLVWTVVGVIALTGIQHKLLSEDKLVLFDDKPVKGFYGSGWKGSKLGEVAAPTRNKSSKALGVTISTNPEKGGGMNFYTKKDENYLDISEFQKADGSLQFYINAPKGAQNVSIGIYNVINGKREIDLAKIVQLSSYIKLDNDPATWQKVSIALKDLAAMPYTKFAGIQMRYIGVPEKLLYFDDIIISKEKGKSVPNNKKSTMKHGASNSGKLDIKKRGDCLVSTFECLSVYWAPPGGAENNKCNVFYKAKSETNWKKGYPLWFDKRNGEYRGSIVHLKSGTEYEVKLKLEKTGTEKIMTGSTWSDKFPVVKTTKLPANSAETLKITESGTPQGYILYTVGDSGSSVIDVQNKSENCVTINASYIILRGLTLKNAARYVITLGDCHDVVIEKCDISGWGKIDRKGWGVDFEGAIDSKSQNLTRVIIQRNKIHHPRTDSNNWRENNNGLHPKGPQAITFWDSDGNHVIRYNEVYSDKDHYFNDIFGGAHNFSYKGFPNRDSDIYGNRISNCWDDGIEAEGANCNVRIWGNYIDETYQKIAVASVSYGPIYIWRNIAGAAKENDIGAGYDPIRGGFLKTSHKMGGGKIYVFHNTLLQPLAPKDKKHELNTKFGGCSAGLGSGGPMLNVMSRNNILHISWWRWMSIFDKNRDQSNDLDYDIFNGEVQLPKMVKSEFNGIRAIPVYDPKNKTGQYALDKLSPGFDAGAILPNFNDNYTGKAPDIGAFEKGSKAMQFGVKAYLKK